MMLCKKHLGYTLTILGAIFYVACYFWGLVIPEEVRELHANLLRISVLGWSGMNLVSFLLGALQWAIWGWLIGTGFSLIGEWCEKKCSHGKK